MRSDFASIQMYYPERGSGGELRLLASHGFKSQAVKFWEWVRADSQCTCGVALRTGRRIVASDVETADFLAGTADLATYQQTGIRAVQSTPLVSRDGKLLGMISTHWRKPHQPSERDLRLLDILVRQAADLIERKQAEETQQLLTAELSRRVEKYAGYGSGHRRPDVALQPRAVRSSWRTSMDGCERWRGRIPFLPTHPGQEHICTIFFVIS